MDYNFLTVIVALLLNAISNFFEGFQAYQARKSNFDSIDLDYQKRYAELLDKAQDFYNFIEDPNFEIKQIQDNTVHRKLIHWAEKYFRLCFEQWRTGHISKSVPKYISKGWDDAIKDALAKPFFLQLWQEEFRKRNFNGFVEFNKYINTMLKK